MVVSAAIRAGSAFVELFVDQSKLTRGLRAAQARIKAFSGTLKSVGSQLVTLGVGGATGLGFATSFFADFEEQMTAVRSRMTEGEAAFKSLEAEAQRLGATTSFSATQAASAMLEFTKAGKSASETLKGTGPVLDFAVANQLELAEAAGIVLQTLESMEIPFERVAEVTDIIGFAANNARTDVRQLAEGFGKVAPVANNLGIELQEVAAATAQLQAAGLEGSEAGVGLRGILLSLVKDTPKARKALEDFGIVFEEGKAVSIVEVFRQIRDRVKDLDQVGRTRELQKLFEARQIAGAAILAANVEKVADNTRKAADESEGYSKRIAAMQIDTLKGQLTILQSSLEGIAIEIGKTLLPLLKEWGQSIRAGVRFIGNWVKGNSQMIPLLAKLAVGFVAVGGTLITLGILLGSLATVLGSIITVATTVGGVLSTALGLLLTPAGAIVATLTLIAALVTDLGELGSRIFSSLGQGFRDAGGVFTASWQGIVDAVQSGDLQQATKIVTQGMVVIWKTALASMRQAWVELQNSLADVAEGAQTNVAKVLNRSLGGLRLLVSDVVNLADPGERKKQEARIRREVNGINDQLGQMQREGEAARRATVDPVLQRLKAELKQEQDDLKKLIDDAAKQRLEADIGAANAVAEGQRAERLTEDDLLRIPALKKLDGIDLRARADTVGGFSLNNLMGTGPQNLAKEQIEAIEEGNDILAKIDRKLGGDLGIVLG